MLQMMNQLVSKADTTTKADISRRHFLEAQQLCRNNYKRHGAGLQIGRLGDRMHSADPSRTMCSNLVPRAELQISVRSITIVLHLCAAV